MDWVRFNPAAMCSTILREIYFGNFLMGLISGQGQSKGVVWGVILVIHFLRLCVNCKNFKVSLKFPNNLSECS